MQVKEYYFEHCGKGGPKDLKGDVGGGIFCKDARGGILSLPFFFYDYSFFFVVVYVVQ